ncbi:hypothetical protein [Mycobacterium innocens]|nr:MULTISPECIES: hypothetical protein [Mycobacterium]
MTRLASKLALVSVAAVGLNVPTMGLALPPKSCLWTSGVASAAPSPAPSPTCASDLRECLHASVKTGLYGVRYVLPEDVARCVEAFNACRHGGAGGGGNPVPPKSTSAQGGRTTLPNRFEIRNQGMVSDCQVDGSTVNCTSRWETPPEGYVSFTGKFTGTLSGLTMNGTATSHSEYRSPSDPGCISNEDYSGPVTYVFRPDGGVTFTAGPNQRHTSFSGSCSGSNSGTTEEMKGTATWSPIE